MITGREYYFGKIIDLIDCVQPNYCLSNFLSLALNHILNFNYFFSLFLNFFINVNEVTHNLEVSNAPIQAFQPHSKSYQ